MKTYPTMVNIRIIEMQYVYNKFHHILSKKKTPKIHINVHLDR